MELEDTMVLNNVTKFRKILIKTIQLKSGRPWVRRTGVTLNAPAKAGA